MSYIKYPAKPIAVIIKPGTVKNRAPNPLNAILTEKLIAAPIDAPIPAPINWPAIAVPIVTATFSHALKPVIPSAIFKPNS